MGLALRKRKVERLWVCYWKSLGVKRESSGSIVEGIKVERMLVGIW